MEIDIIQKEITIRDIYQIFIDGELRFSAKTDPLNLLPEINLFTNSGGNAIVTIKKKASFLKLKYEISFQNNLVYDFKSASFLKSQYTCEKGNDKYNIYGHKGRKYSIFQNDIQIGWWDKNLVSYYKADTYKIRANADSNVELLICFCLIIDHSSSSLSDSSNTVNIDLGNIGFGLKKFDENWFPT